MRSGGRLPELTGWDPTAYPALQEWLGPVARHPLVRRIGRLAGGWQAQACASAVDRNPPRVVTRRRRRRRVDEVVYHPAYHELMRVAVEAGLAGGRWDRDGWPPEGGELTLTARDDARAAALFAWMHTDLAHGQALALTHAVAAELRSDRQWGPGLKALAYDARPLWRDAKRGVTAGVLPLGDACTAVETGDGMWRLRGGRRFCLAPMSDVFLTLASTSRGPTSFLVPRVLPDGTPNRIRIRRLETTSGMRSLAAADLELSDALAWRHGWPGDGDASLSGVVHRLRIDCMISAAACAHHAVAYALHRLGRRVRRDTLLAAVVADLAVECEAMTCAALRLAPAFSGEYTVLGERSRMAIAAVPVLAHWITRRAVAVVATAVECVGADAHGEHATLARLYRDVSLLPLLAAPGALDGLGVLHGQWRDGPSVLRSEEPLEHVFLEMDNVGSSDRRLAAEVALLRVETSDPENLQCRARALAERIACGLQAAWLLQRGAQPVADAFCATRLPDDEHPHRSLTFGTLPDWCDLDTILDRAEPQPAQ